MKEVSALNINKITCTSFKKKKNGTKWCIKTKITHQIIPLSRFKSLKEWKKH